MAHILIVIILSLGTVKGHYLGEYHSEKECHKAANQAVQDLRGTKLVKDVDAVGLICVPKPVA